MENEIAISGTGIAGLATATAIIAADHDCGSDHPHKRGGVQLAPNGWAALSVLGLAQGSRATRLHEITVRSLTNSATLARLPLKDVYASVARADLATVFEQRISFRRHNTTVEQVSQTETGSPSLARTQASIMLRGLVDGVAGFGRAFISGQSETEGLIGNRQGGIEVNNKPIGSTKLFLPCHQQSLAWRRRSYCPLSDWR